MDFLRPAIAFCTVPPWGANPIPNPQHNQLRCYFTGECAFLLGDDGFGSTNVDVITFYFCIQRRRLPY